MFIIRRCTDAHSSEQIIEMKIVQLFTSQINPTDRSTLKRKRYGDNAGEQKGTLSLEDYLLKRVQEVEQERDGLKRDLACSKAASDDCIIIDNDKLQLQKRVKKLVAEKNGNDKEIKALKFDLDLARTNHLRSSKDNEELHNLLDARQQLHEKQKSEIKTLKSIHALEASKNASLQSEILKLKAGWSVCLMCWKTTN